MTFEVILIYMKYFCIHNNSYHINFYQNQLINECVIRNFLKLKQFYLFHPINIILNILQTLYVHVICTYSYYRLKFSKVSISTNTKGQVRTFLLCNLYTFFNFMHNFFCVIKGELRNYSFGEITRFSRNLVENQCQNRQILTDRQCFSWPDRNTDFLQIWYR